MNRFVGRRVAERRVRGLLRGGDSDPSDRHRAIGLPLAPFSVAGRPGLPSCGIASSSHSSHFAVLRPTWTRVPENARSRPAADVPTGGWHRN
jgi:hypothetical protein